MSAPRGGGAAGGEGEEELRGGEGKDREGKGRAIGSPGKEEGLLDWVGSNTFRPHRDWPINCCRMVRSAVPRRFRGR